MAEQQVVNLMTVIRADGTVPFDDSVPAHLKALHIKGLMDAGHEVVPHPVVKGHYFIKNFKKQA